MIYFESFFLLYTKITLIHIGYRKGPNKRENNTHKSLISLSSQTRTRGWYLWTNIYKGHGGIQRVPIIWTIVWHIKSYTRKSWTLLILFFPQNRIFFTNSTHLALESSIVFAKIKKYALIFSAPFFHCGLSEFLN